MTIFVDRNYKCYTQDGDGRTAHEVPFFDGKCREFVEGYFYIPQGETLEMEDGVVLNGEMISVWRDSSVLDAFQRQYEEMLSEAEAAYERGVNSI